VVNAAKHASAKRTAIRDQLWPEASSIVFDPRDPGTKGYSQVPRVVPLVARLINEIDGPENAGALYQVLWAHDWGQGIVEVRSFRTLLYEAGYQGKGPRVERTWKERIQILTRLGFIETRNRGLEEHAFILLIDPHVAVLKLEAVELERSKQFTFDQWIPQFRITCEQWGIDLESYRGRAFPEAAR
jgi:hypothetical protein